MNNDRKIEIINATVALAAKHGLKNVSLTMVANAVGIKKPSLYNHFKSKEQLITSAYEYLRDNAKKSSALYGGDPLISEAELKQGTAEQILTNAVLNYAKMCNEANMLAFYKILYAGRAEDGIAAKILTEETEKMINATELLFSAMQKFGKLYFNDVKKSALSFALTVHGIIDYNEDKSTATGLKRSGINELSDFVKWFCAENAKIKDRL